MRKGLVGLLHRLGSVLKIPSDLDDSMVIVESNAFEEERLPYFLGLVWLING